MKPALEAFGLTNGANVKPSGEQSFLHCVGGLFVAAQDQAGSAVQSVDHLADQLPERVVIAVARPNDQFSLHCDSR
jgi:hypothetical protein